MLVLQFEVADLSPKLEGGAAVVVASRRREDDPSLQDDVDVRCAAARPFGNAEDEWAELEFWVAGGIIGRMKDVAQSGRADIARGCHALHRRANVVPHLV